MFGFDFIQVLSELLHRVGSEIAMQVWPCNQLLPRLLGMPLSHSRVLSSPRMNPMSSIEKSLGSEPEYRFGESASNLM